MSRDKFAVGAARHQLHEARAARERKELTVQPLILNAPLDDALGAAAPE